MPNYRRYDPPGALIFITCVTHHRAPILSGARNLELFWATLKAVQKLHPFHLFAYVILPDHFHWILQLPEVDGHFSTILHSVKRNFSLQIKHADHLQGAVQVWQERFWDHVIRNETDLNRHVDYIHWNPVKHGYVQDPWLWAESSFCFWARKGVYPDGWGQNGEPENIKDITAD